MLSHVPEFCPLSIVTSPHLLDLVVLEEGTSDKVKRLVVSFSILNCSFFFQCTTSVHMHRLFLSKQKSPWSKPSERCRLFQTMLQMEK